MKVLAILVLVAACGHGTTAEPDTFIAFNPTFAPFRTWTMFHSEGPIDDGSQPPTVLGPRDQYVNKIPPAGALEFPVGTVIVEVRTDTGKIFSSVKRGGDFNAGGAIDWEYFELQEAPVMYIWRGLGPPLGDTYGGDPNGCNLCHTQCVANDYICSPKLQLASF